ncbi:hypothetical protein Agabi119p4_8447 [Agaricus bisporus var. burnettii]|uniref:Uncharacterized protein n=1 Tax=Agaricus bisporus var. burnettii TaxID=192524 RepID=A0A8H7C690_AGABI|nr:hypothetical protein Agabi119p4_8447 [Agaricus bisporus var. burnettii]
MRRDHSIKPCTERRRRIKKAIILVVSGVVPAESNERRVEIGWVNDVGDWDEKENIDIVMACWSSWMIGIAVTTKSLPASSSFSSTLPLKTSQQPHGVITSPFKPLMASSNNKGAKFRKVIGVGFELGRTNVCETTNNLFHRFYQFLECSQVRYYGCDVVYISWFDADLDVFCYE